MPEHKNKSRAPLRPLNVPTLALSVGGLGFLRPAPGTWGSVPPAAMAFVMVLAGAPLLSQFIAMTALMVLGTAACVEWGRYAEERFGRKDAAEVVADETAGGAIVVAAACYWLRDGSKAFGEVSFIEAALVIGWAFVLFRIMDIIKPWPGRLAERLPRGWGVAADDLVAGAYGLLALNISLWALMRLTT